MQLIKLSIVENAGLTEQYIRPYESELKANHVDNFVKLTKGGENLSVRNLAKVAHSILTPATTNTLRSHIRGGWDSKRMMFAMVVALNNRDGISKDYEYIVGFTDTGEYSTISGKARFDPNMRMYFNSITRIHLTEAMYGRNNRVWQPKLQAHDQVLHKSALVGEGRGGRQTRPVSLRPTDLFRRKGGDSAFSDTLRDSELQPENLVGAFTSPLRASTRLNNSAANFLSRSISAYVAADSDPSNALAGDLEDDDVLNNSCDAVDENQLTSDPWFEEYQRETNILEAGYITFGELMDMNRDFDEDRSLPFTPLSSRRKRDSIGTENQCGWKGANVETIAATLIANSLPAIMLNSMYSKVDNLVLNSRARMGEYKVNAGKVFPYVDGLEIKATWPYFESMVADVLMEEVTKGGMFEIEASIDANIDQMIQMWITIDGGEEAYFEFPAFADGMLASTMGENLTAIDHLAKNIVDLSAAVSSERHNQSPAHVATAGIVLNTDLSSARLDRDDRPRRDTGTNQRSDTRSRTAARDW